jgi:hypothetical protein
VIDPDYKAAFLAKYGGRNSVSEAPGDMSLVTISSFPPAAGLEPAVLSEGQGRSGREALRM